MNKQNIKNIIEGLVNIGERQIEGEKKAREFIVGELKKIGVAYYEQVYVTSVPRFVNSRLLVDGKEVASYATSMVSGKINGSSHLISSLTSSQDFLEKPNINFNPQCDAISRSNHYFAPSLAISKKDVPQVLNAKKVEGEVRVRKVSYQSSNILVGNKRRPKNIYFCHYDSIGPGAIDNASGVALMFYLIAAGGREVLKESLFVFAGNEELSYDRPIYWGHGYRVFEATYKDQLLRTKNIFVLDSLGPGAVEINQDPKITTLAFPIKNQQKIKERIFLVTGNIDNLMSVYHSELDTPDKVDVDEILKVAKKLL